MNEIGTQIGTAMLIPSGMKTGFSTNLPAQMYTCRIKSAARHTPADPAKKDNLNIKFSCEIMAPDQVTDEAGQIVRAAGRAFDIYCPIATAMKNFESSFELLGKLQLLRPEGGFIPDEVINQANTGLIWFSCLIICEPEFFTTKNLQGNEVAVLVNGQPMLKGYRIKFPEIAQIGGRVEVPPGFAPPPF